MKAINVSRLFMGWPVTCACLMPILRVRINAKSEAAAKLPPSHGDTIHWLSVRPTRTINSSRVDSEKE